MPRSMLHDSVRTYVRRAHALARQATSQDNHESQTHDFPYFLNSYDSYGAPLLVPLPLLNKNFKLYPSPYIFSNNNDKALWNTVIT